MVHPRIIAKMGPLKIRIDPTTRECELLGTYPGLHSDIALAGDYLYGFTEINLVRLKVE